MPILFDKNENIFYLNTKNTSYVMAVFKEKYLLHLHYGKRIDMMPNVHGAIPLPCRALSAIDINDLYMSTDVMSLEYPCYGSADLRTPAFHAEYENGSAITKLEYQGYEIFKGKKALNGLPATYVEANDEADTLEITLKDSLTNLSVVLSYTVFNTVDAIAKSVRIINGGGERVNLKSVLSSTFYLSDKDYDFVHLHGAWARERSIQKKPLMNGIMQVDSKRVSSSHHHSPFLALARPYATEAQGDVYGMSFVYSGNHIEQVEVNSFEIARVNVGINPFGFNWVLEPCEDFQAPEVILTYSSEGYGKMSRTYHELYRTRLVRGRWRDKERPVLINNWEATYFGFNEEKILEIAKKAKSVGVELMVLDDGWFGKRDNDNCSLGDWYADKKKLPGGIDGLAKKVNDIGMQFGLWFEPEMISEDSDLYRAHPDWLIHVEGRESTPGRQQYVLDLSRKDVCDYVVDAVCSVLASAPITYVKWDYNRNITELGSSLLPPERQQELPHRYILGLYDCLERITSANPDVLFEGCSGGGGRFDAGMLYYFQQYWTSDNTDAIERLYIQHGTSMVMPSVTMGAHVSACPNHQIGRTTPLLTRGHVAMAGQFGYELDLNTLSDEEIEIVKNQITMYKDIRKTVQKGQMYRLKSPFEDTQTAWEYVGEDQVVLMYFTMFVRCESERVRVKLLGLDEDATYTDTESGVSYSGRYLMNFGLNFEDRQDFNSRVIIFKKA